MRPQSENSMNQAEWQGGSVWGRMKEALRRDWDQTQWDFARKRGRDVDQTATDTVKQVLGLRPLPRPDQPNDHEVKKHGKWPSLIS